MDEYIDIATKDGKLTGASKLKSVIHAKGYFHHTAHIWFFTSNSEILLSQRSANKIICPLMWDVSVAGHIHAGETIEQAAIRETEEEIGLAVTKNDLHKIGVFKCFQTYENGLKDYEFHNTFIANLKVPLSQLTPQKEEVEALKLVPLAKFKSLIDNIESNGNHFVPSNKSYYQFILKSVKTYLK